MAATSLFLVRDALHALFAPPLAGAGVELLEAVPSEAEDMADRRVAWWSNEVDVTAQPYTMPNGLVENYQQLLVVKVLPDDGDTGVGDARADAVELLDLLYDTARANRRPLSGEEWDAVVEWGGFVHLAARLERPAGFAAGFEVRLNVEATRCS